MKAFNHIYASDLTADGRPSGDPDRRALAIAGDDEAAKEAVASFIDTIGFDVVVAGALGEGWRYQKDTPAYGARLTAAELRNALASAKRYSDM